MLRALIKSMRLRQWPKNVFLLAAMVFDKQLINVTSLVHSLIGFFLFCFLSSGVYIINDIIDIEADRKHPEKNKRPIASGLLPVTVAIAAASVLVVLPLVGAFLLSPTFALVALIYLVLNLIYSKWLKHIPLIDVLVLASFYVIRVIAGVTLIKVERFSPWLYIVTTLFALYIGLGKRRAELKLMAENAREHRRVLDGYSIPLLDQLITIVSGTTIVAYSLYTFTAENLQGSFAMMLTIPFVMYGIFRYLYLIQVKQSGGAPEDLLFTDRPLQIDILLWVVAILIIFYLIMR
jgi:4-hydroxybenzoate polyprenyltransferase